jgi:hypothetical protein
LVALNATRVLVRKRKSWCATRDALPKQEHG